MATEVKSTPRSSVSMIESKPDIKGLIDDLLPPQSRDEVELVEILCRTSTGDTYLAEYLYGRLFPLFSELIKTEEERYDIETSLSEIPEGTPDSRYLRARLQWVKNYKQALEINISEEDKTSMLRAVRLQ